MVGAVALTIGTGPFGTQPAGRFNFDPPRHGVLYLEESPHWVRARRGGQTVVDSRRARMLHEQGRLPVFWFPEEDVRADLLPDDAVIRRDDELLSGLVAVDWGAADEWLDEDEPLLGHARDPYHRIDVRRTSRHVVVRVGDDVVADSTRTLVLFETGLPRRWYIPEDDVRMELLGPTGTDTVCAYKGHASYWSIGDEDDVVWTYRDPEPEVAPIKDHLSFFNERVQIEVDGEPEPKLQTQWSRE
jgi:uncharacterized protein (DUF427 family)